MRKRGKAKTRTSIAVEETSSSSENEKFLLGRSWLAPLVVFAGLLGLYVATLAPSVVGGDSGELTAAALSGGVPHPPGYPLFCMLARLFNLLPFGPSPAWRVNLLSAVATAGAGAMVCATVQAWTRQAAAGLAAAAMFGANEVVWRHATSAEVFGINAFFVAVALFLWLGIERASEPSRARRLVFGLFLTCGLAMTNHHTFLFVGAPLALRSLWVAKRHLRQGGLWIALGIGLLGLLPYAYLYFASRVPGAVTWGDQTTLDGFVAHILRRNYGTFSMGRATQGGAFASEGTFWPTLWRMVAHAFPRFAWLGGFLVVVGAYAGVRAGSRSGRERAAGLVLLAVFGVYVVAFSALSNLSLEKALFATVMLRFCIQSDLILAIVGGLGFAFLLELLHARATRVPSILRFAPLLALLPFAVGVLAHEGECNQRKNRVFVDFLATAFASLPPNAVIMTVGDHVTGSAFYFHHVEGLRPDVIHLDVKLLAFPWYVERVRRQYPGLHLPDGVYGPRGWNIKQFLDGNPHRPLTVIDRLDSWDEGWKDGYKLASIGLVHRLVPSAQFPSFEQWLDLDRQAIANYSPAQALRARDGSWERMLGQLALTTQNGRARLALGYSSARGNAEAPARVAVRFLEDIVSLTGGDEGVGIAAHPGMPRSDTRASVWKNLAIGYQILSGYDSTYLKRTVAACERFLARAEPGDDYIATARGLIDRFRSQSGAGPQPPAAGP